MESLLENIKNANDKITQYAMMKRRGSIDNLYTDLETMYLEELLKSSYFNFEKLNQEINDDDRRAQTHIGDLIEIDHVVASFYCDLYKNDELLKIFESLETNFEDDKLASSYIGILKDIPPSDILAKKLNQLYQTYEISFKSVPYCYGWDQTDSTHRLVVHRTIRL
jgi:hypothetical protein